MTKENWIELYTLADKACRLLANPDTPKADWDKANELRELAWFHLAEIHNAERS